MTNRSHRSDRTDLPDRIAPTYRPHEPVVMRQEWRHLSFLHWPVAPEVVRALLPDDLTVDTFEGRAYVGLVPFTMRNVRPAGAPAVRGLSYFHETNVRTYVHHRGGHPGVWFFSLDAANEIAVRIARTVWKLPYHYARMSLGGDGESIVYASERCRPGPLPGDCRATITPTGNAFFAVPGTLEHFLAERYLLYSRANGRLYRGRVHHAPYPLRSARLETLTESLTGAAGFAFDGPPPLVHYAAGVEVDVFPLRPILLR
ncbi:MAG: DUF2071 domain-containing protein [Capsulimonadales bacterium]|nr:DUF2071 domain-containing protein [Capsulimonadales bacterium]